MIEEMSSDFLQWFERFLLRYRRQELFWRCLGNGTKPADNKPSSEMFGKGIWNHAFRSFRQQNRSYAGREIPLPKGDLGSRTSNLPCSLLWGRLLLFWRLSLSQHHSPPPVASIQLFKKCFDAGVSLCVLFPFTGSATSCFFAIKALQSSAKTLTSEFTYKSLYLFVKIDWRLPSESKVSFNYKKQTEVGEVASKTTWHWLPLFKEAADVEDTLKFFRSNSPQSSPIPSILPFHLSPGFLWLRDHKIKIWQMNIWL